MRSIAHIRISPVSAAVAAAVAGLFFLTSCSSGILPSFERQPDGTYVIPEDKFGRFARTLSEVSTDEADSLISVLYDFADSVSYSSEDGSTLRRLSEMFAETFFVPGNPAYDEDIYAAVLKREKRCRAVTSEERLGIEWYLNMISCNRPGSGISDMLLVSPDGKESFLHDEIDRPTLIFLYGSQCSLCRSLAVGLSSSQKITSACRSGDISLMSIYIGEDDDIYASMSRQLGPLWENFRDAELAVQMRNIFDLRLVPSIYAVSADRTVLVKGSTDIPSVEKKLPQLCR